jgi:hypothetical protein
MWVATVTLLSLLAALGYVARAARRLDSRLDTVLRREIDSRRALEAHVQLVRDGSPLARG